MCRMGLDTARAQHKVDVLLGCYQGKARYLPNMYNELRKAVWAKVTSKQRSQVNVSEQKPKGSQ